MDEQLMIRFLNHPESCSPEQFNDMTSYFINRLGWVLAHCEHFYEEAENTRRMLCPNMTHYHLKEKVKLVNGSLPEIVPEEFPQKREYSSSDGDQWKYFSKETVKEIAEGCSKTDRNIVKIEVHFEDWDICVCCPVMLSKGSKKALNKKFDIGFFKPTIDPNIPLNIVRCVCGRKSCPDGSKLKLCRKCKVATYCSKECQNKDWISTHRNQCPSLVENKQDHIRSEARLARKLVREFPVESKSHK